MYTQMRGRLRACHLLPWSLGLRVAIPKCFGCLGEDPQTGGFCGNGSFLAL